MPEVRFDTYYRYADLTDILRAFSEEYPDLVRLDSLGKSHENRDIWLVTVTNFASGEDRDKPALWVDGNIHASEVSPSSACLYLLNTLVNGYGSDSDVTRCLDTRTFYICPRVNPDGAEWALETPPRLIRSSTRPYPYDEEPFSGLKMEDVDGDGRILAMRIADPAGTWKVSEEEPRLLVRRDPTETGEQYYRVLPEGRIHQWDGVMIALQPRKEALDLNRNFPQNWRQESEQAGSGPYPTSEPEVQSLSRFIADHLNITGAITFHTFSGVLLRPYSNQSDDAFPAEDLWTYQKIGQRGTEITGYPQASVYHEFRYHPKQFISGDFDSWMFDHLGVFAWTVELWSPQRQAGISDYKYIDWYREHPFDDDVKLLKWSDERLGGKGYVDWYEFAHPELGTIELGGWDDFYAFSNPPPQFLEGEIAPFADWLLWHLLISPRLELHTIEIEPLGKDSHSIRFAVCNSGWLPTYISKTGLEKKVVRGVQVQIELPDGATRQSGKQREDLGQLEGRAYKASSPIEAADVTDDRAQVTWVVHAPNGGVAKLTARHDRAGVVRTEIEL
jgi:murein tripeptide amidase MpaA